MVNVDQFVDTLVPNDAISNYCLQIKDLIQSLGYESKIYCKKSLVQDEDIIDYRDELATNAKIIFHHSTYSPLVAKVIQMQNSKILIYHNITPAAFFRENYYPYYSIFKEAERQNFMLRQTDFEAIVGDSKYNLEQMFALLPSVKKKFVHPPFLTLQFKKKLSDVKPIPDLIKDNFFNIIFVGRIVPNKKQDDLVKIFEYYSKFIQQKSRLILIGNFWPNDPYFMDMFKLIAKRQINNVDIKGNVNSDDLAAYYRSSQLFLSMSEHEGFGIPILEAINYELPVLAYRIPALEEILTPDNLFNTKNFPSITKRMLALQTSNQKRQQLLASQAKVLDKFQDDILQQDFIKILKISFNL